MNLTSFYTKNKRERSILKNIPLGYLKLVMTQLRDEKFNPTGRKFRVLYRGPRRTDPRDTRSNYSKQSGCIKKCATRFSVYLDTRKAVR